MFLFIYNLIQPVHIWVKVTSIQFSIGCARTGLFNVCPTHFRIRTLENVNTWKMEVSTNR